MGWTSRRKRWRSAMSRTAIRTVRLSDVTYRELKQRTIATANLFHSLGVGPDDAVLYLMPTMPELYTVMLGSLAAGISCCTNWMLEPSHWAGLIRASRAKVVVALGPTPGYEIWEKLQTIRADLPPACSILSVQMPGGEPLAEFRCRASGVEAAERQACLHAQGRARRHRRLRAFRRHHRLAQAGEAHAPRLLLQVLGQHAGDGAHRGRRDLRRLSDVPHRRLLRPRHHGDRGRHGDRDPVADRRARQALHRELLEVRREVPHHASCPACRPRWRSSARRRRRART